MNTSKIFHNTWALQQLPVTMRLYNLEWRFLICADGKTPVNYIQKRLNLTDRQTQSIVTRLCDTGLLTETTLSLEDYARTTVDTASTTEEHQTLNEYLQTSEPVEPSPQEKKMPSFSPLPKPTVSTTPSIRAMSLQAVIQFILNQHPDATAGQLATYQVFMGVNTQLLKKNGITSLRFQDDRYITDPELQTAIAENIQKTLKVPCPEEVFSGGPTLLR